MHFHYTTDTVTPEIYKFLSPYPIDATYQIWSSLAQ